MRLLGVCVALALVAVASAQGCDPGFYGTDCLCDLPTLPTTTTRPAYVVNADTPNNPPVRSGISSGSLSLVIAESLKYSRRGSGDAIFSLGTSACSSTMTWSKHQTAGGADAEFDCSRLWVGVIPVSNIFGAACGAVEATAANGFRRFIYDLRWNVTETFTLSNGVSQTREIEASVPFEVQFLTDVAITAGNVQAFSQIAVLSAISNQAITATGTVTRGGQVQIFTSVQYPFSLTGLTLGGAPSSNGGQPVAPASGVHFPADVTVTVGNSGSPDQACGSVTNGQICTQKFTFNLAATAGTGSGERCDMNGAYTFWASVQCVEGAAANCPLDPVNQFASSVVALTVTLTTGNFCPQVVDTVGISGSLTSYETNSFTIQKDDFLQGQRMFFRLSMKAAQATLSGVRVTGIRVQNPPGNAITLASTTSGTTSIASGNTFNLNVEEFQPLNTFRACATQAVGAAAQCYWDFSFLAMSDALNVPLEGSSVVTVTVDVTVAYRDAIQGNEMVMQMQLPGSWSTQQAAQSTQISSVQTLSGRAPSTAGSSSSALGGSTGLALAASGFAFVVALVAVAIVVVRRRRNTAELLPSGPSSLELKPTSSV